MAQRARPLKRRPRWGLAALLLLLLAGWVWWSSSGVQPAPERATATAVARTESTGVGREGARSQVSAAAHVAQAPRPTPAPPQRPGTVQLLADMHAVDRDYCGVVGGLWPLLQGAWDAVRNAPPDPKVAAMQSPDFVENAKQRVKALRLAQLERRSDAYAQALADWMRGKTHHLPALALSSPDPRLLRLALHHGCSDAAADCRRALAERWLRLEPGNGAAWLAQWGQQSAQAGSEALDALLDGMVQSHFFNDGSTEPAVAVRAEPGPGAQGLHAALEQMHWDAVNARTWIPNIGLWVRHCRPPGTEPGSPRAVRCLASADAIWRSEPGDQVVRAVAMQVAENLGAAAAPHWAARQRQLRAVRAMRERLTPVLIGKNVASGLVCRPSADATRYLHAQQHDGEYIALLRELRHAGLDEEQLAQEFLTKEAQRQAARAKKP